MYSAPVDADVDAATTGMADAVPPYEEVPLADMEHDEDEGMYYYKCPCGDLFEISQAELDVGEEIARCPSCSLYVRVLREDK
jgi:diphthamide biosynthesis protein 3